jgi:PAS domain S-box-containing protein
VSERPVPLRPRRARLQRVFAALVIVALAGVLGLVANSTRLLDRMTGDVALAQRRAENLSNAQREVLRLLQAVTEIAAAGDPTGEKRTGIPIRRALFDRQVNISHALFPPDSAEAREANAITALLDGLDWESLNVARPNEARTKDVIIGVTMAEKRVKALYDGQTKLFYTVTTQSLRAKEQGQRALGGLVGLVAALGFGWIITIRRTNRSDLRVAYDALVVEMDERRAAEDAVRTSEQRFRSLVQRASDLTGVTDEHGVFTYVSPAVETLLGFRPDEFVGTALADRIHEGDRDDLAAAVDRLSRDPAETATVDFRIQASDGRWRNIEAVGRNLMEDSTIHGIVWNGRDVTDRRILQDELAHQAYHDALTTLPNRALLLDRLDQALAGARRNRGVAVLLIDLDGFKGVNDTLGHQAGDELLREIAERLTRCLRAEDTAARLGGDEFAVIVDGVGSAPSAGSAGGATSAGSPSVAGEAGRDVHVIAERILVAIREPITVAGRTVSVGASIGVATGSPDTDPSDLLRDADIAMYSAKAAGKNRVETFEPLMLDHTTERSTLEQQLAGAVARGEIEVHYQPIVDLRTGRILALESLARWRHPERGLVPPGVFIPIAEQAGLIVELGRHMLFEACAAVARWRRMPEHRDLGVTVNVSGRQALTGELYHHVVRALESVDLEPSALTLEITESVLLDDTEAVRAHFTRLRNLGVHIAVDDFGAGYSSIGSLLRFSADVLKIDRSFLEFDTARNGSLVQAVSDLGRTLNLLVVAEGVETAQQLALARAAGCQAAQGYGFARPADEEQTTRLLLRDPDLTGPVEDELSLSAG